MATEEVVFGLDCNTSNSHSKLMAPTKQHCTQVPAEFGFYDLLLQAPDMPHYMHGTEGYKKADWREGCPALNVARTSQEGQAHAEN
jgi:hypothetical protein